ncbi:MAG: aldo/keto reductase [Chloroflexi bacterium]|nr:aldo/keto reductase [Chloroflexota bacterium]
MRYRTFPRCEVTVSEIGFGVWTLTAGWWGSYTEDEAVALLRQAYDLGVTFYDTADTYGNGWGETILARAFGSMRDKIVIGTKFGYDFYSNPGQRTGQREWPQNWTAKYLRFALEQSLTRLGTDYVDLYQLHNPRMDALRTDEVFIELDRLVQEGKIRAYATALGPALQERQIEEGIASYQTRNCHGVQIIYNLLEQMLGEAIFPVARQYGGGLMVRVPHSSGMLEGKYTPETTFPKEDHRSHRPKEWLIEGLKKIEKLTFLTEGRDLTLGQAALKFILAEPSVTNILPNIYNAEQLVEFAAASDQPDLTADDLARIADLYQHNFYLEPSGVA